MSKTMKCPQCGKLFVFGVTGARGLGKARKCDECQGIERDDTGNAWLPWEKSGTFHILGTDDIHTVSRPATHKTWNGK